MKSRSDNQEELVLPLQEILCRKDLPPIRKTRKIEFRQLRYLQQLVMLTSLGSSSMRDSITAIQAIHHTFLRAVPDDSMEEWAPTMFEDYEAVDMGNRYFTNRKHISSSEVVRFKAGVDPDGMLEAVSEGTDVAHTWENEVEYFELCKHTGGQKRYNVIDPIKFRIGDIVEAQVSFVVVPLKGKKYKMIIVLRALTLLDSTPLKDAEKAKYHERLQDIPRPLSLKRKVGYYEDEEEETRFRMHKMAIDKHE
ncbi:hypothetical protein L208DRAFT_1320145 [Tricholoma matsutake]|nr:hypothetical protein L208DRAFT_1320145 [Tricholoma matsutake 945]